MLFNSSAPRFAVDHCATETSHCERDASAHPLPISKLPVHARTRTVSRKSVYQMCRHCRVVIRMIKRSKSVDIQRSIRVNLQFSMLTTARQWSAFGFCHLSISEKATSTRSIHLSQISPSTSASTSRQTANLAFHICQHCD